jgi:SPFH domain / Band 7 family
MIIKSLSCRRLFSSSSNYYRYGSSPRSFDQRPLPVNTIIKFVPQQQAWVVERFGKFNRILEPGLAILFPFIDQIRYVKTLKEVAVEIPSQAAITHDNVTINMDGVLYYRVIEPFKVSFTNNSCTGLLWS